MLIKISCEIEFIFDFQNTWSLIKLASNQQTENSSNQAGQFDAISSGINVNPGYFLSMVKTEVLKTFHSSGQSWPPAPQSSQLWTLQSKNIKPFLNLFPPKRYSVVCSGWENKALPLSHQLVVFGPDMNI